jgi:V8-like Glu-specific endopeptidase
MQNLVIIALLTSFSLLANASDKVVYGVDNRVDLFQTEVPLFYELAHSTAAMIRTSDLTENGETVTISGNTLESRGICPTARFAKQLTAASCSGFLVGPNLLVTAGHCITSQSDCNSFSWVFDYNISEDGEKIEYSVPSSSVYKCSKIIQQDLSRSTMNDFALIQLDREVNDRTPLEYRKEGQVELEDSLVVIGHPSGLPTKIADGAWVRTNDNPYYFVTNLDTFGGNSGSAVFNTETGVVEGILVRGERDYEWDSRGCRVPKVCDENECRGEDVTRITVISELITKTLTNPVVEPVTEPVVEPVTEPVVVPGSEPTAE